ncbi:unnamed protein product [Vitrella brassicaformis CCMP3155]|uniref:TLDc domain-containing protein n=1 Tax=Vitrella brassicaformis (strain CCMP3155) TaxID=1169540 RepID=A0A0G4GTU7_VITBC|nr:unnamed protein product [Vitrella brassicaformis CCMP3155]|eukprot:CEM34015.1 unnamed protein product [Vitrella brassicaformis CCMP3155]
MPTVWSDLMLMTMAAWTCVAEARPPAQQVYERGLQGLSGGTSLSASEYEALLGLLGGNDTTRLTSLYRTSVHGTTYDDLLDRVGDAKPLVFVIRKDKYVFGAFISDSLRLPDDPTAWHYYDCHKWYFSLSGHFDKPTKIVLPESTTVPPRMWVAGREEKTLGTNVLIGGQLCLGWANSGGGPPAADIRSCLQVTYRSNVPEGYTGEWDENGDAVLGGSTVFMADEIEVLSRVPPSSARQMGVWLSFCLWLSSFLFSMSYRMM